MDENRFHYDLDSECCIPISLWNQAVKRSIQGKRGQALLQELREALLQLPHRRLIQGSLYNQGECCALGALAIHRLKKGEKIRHISSLEEFEEDSYIHDGNEYELLEFAQHYLDMRVSLAWKISYLNDEMLDFATPEERWEVLMKWVEGSLHPTNEQSDLGGVK